MKHRLFFFFLNILFCKSLFGQLPDLDFENWVTDSSGYLNPVGWSTTNGMGTPAQVTVAQYQPAYSGSYAVAVGVVNNIPVNSSFGGSIVSKFAFTNRPSSISGYFFLPSGYMIPPLNFYMTLKGNSIVVGQGGATIFLWPTAYTYFDFPINYSSQDPVDTAIITAQANWYPTIGPYTGPVFVLDNLSLNYSTGISEIESKSFEVFPNPSCGNLTINFKTPIGNGLIEIYNTLGEKVYSTQIINVFKKEIKLTNISSGIYLVKIFDGQKSYCKKLIIEHD